MKRGAALALAMAMACLLTGCHQTERARVLREMSRRPGDPWPRGAAHVVYGAPGSGEYEKAYHEAGGSFSPSVASFGVSFWVLDAAGRIVATSDSISLSGVHGGLAWSAVPLPDLRTATPFYDVTWRYVAPGRHEALVEPHPGQGLRVALVVRSVGPAGGPVRSLSWSAGSLRVNGRWTLRFPPGAELLASGLETDPQWRIELNRRANSADSNGWCYARVLLPAAGTVTLTDSAARPTAPPVEDLLPRVTVDLPDPAFAESLNAQTAHQMMALVANQPRPGDPMNYPLAWQRDGAYTLASLARAGKLETARQVAGYMASHDFFGGFGPEADAPGLGIWSVEEAAQRLGDPAFDAAVYPSIKRKAHWIERMLSATGELRTEVEGPIAPQRRRRRDLNLVAQPARNGLIVGRMDWQRPLLFINAVSYAGLNSAAEMAARVGDAGEAARWRQLAATLRRAWMAGFATPERANDRTYISGLWPTWVAADRAAWAAALDTRWEKSHTATGEPRTKPLWTYFDIAEAHQHLLLGHPERAWSVLRWYWNHQPSPGMYTWWEGNGEENSFGRWEAVRGWVRPPDVEPHCWTAAEMLLLQLDMLAYADEGAEEPLIVVGAGALPEWLRQPMEARGIATRFGVVDWRWTGSRLVVDLHGATVKVVPGPAFAKAPLSVIHTGNSH